MIKVIFCFKRTLYVNSWFTREYARKKSDQIETQCINCIFAVLNSTFSHTVSHLFSKYTLNICYGPNIVIMLTGNAKVNKIRWNL
jgi:hypothetical protein